MYIKAGYTVKSHKDTRWNFNTLSVSSLERYMFILFEHNEDYMVLTAKTLAFEVVKNSWKDLQQDRHPLAQ